MNAVRLELETKVPVYQRQLTQLEGQLTEARRMGSSVSHSPTADPDSPDGNDGLDEHTRINVLTTRLRERTGELRRIQDQLQEAPTVEEVAQLREQTRLLHSQNRVLVSQAEDLVRHAAEAD